MILSCLQAYFPFYILWVAVFVLLVVAIFKAK